MLGQIFTGPAFDLSRWNPVGTIPMILGVILACLAPSRSSEGLKTAFRVFSVLLFALGALFTLKLI